MTIERVALCDYCGEQIPLADRRRIGVRRDEDRPESAEYVDLCVPHRQLPVQHAIDLAEMRRPVMADGQPA